MTLIVGLLAIGVGWSVAEQIGVRRLKDFVAAGGSICRADGLALTEEEIEREFVAFRSQHRFFRAAFRVIALVMGLNLAYVMLR